MSVGCLRARGRQPTTREREQKTKKRIEKKEKLLLVPGRKARMYKDIKQRREEKREKDIKDE